MKGYNVPRRFGWDCHGLPVEYEINKAHKIESRKDVLNMGVAEYNSLCRGIVKRYSQEEGLIPIQLDVNDEASIQQAAEQCADTTILVNNAGIALLNEHPVDASIITTTQKILETNLLGLMWVTQIFVPILQKNQQAYVVNILSDVSWEPSTVLTSYAISKAAAWSYTNSSRQWLSQFNIQVMGVHVGFIDTDLTRSLPIPKIASETVAQEIFQGIEQNAYEVLVGEKTQQLKQGLSAEVASYVKLKPDQASV
jgi:NAD(P)-dependent dehydrogenase (short-subunit alcohol dehydrogenase family)